MARTGSDPCRCKSYPFPHRAGGGGCTDPGADPGGCEDCPHARWQSDPFCTGDRWYSEAECELNECPWGHD